MGHKSIYVRTGTEADAIYARHRYCYLKNRHGLVRQCKRWITKRERKAKKNEINKLELLENE